MKHLVYIGLGTNLGRRLGNLKAAAQALQPPVVPLEYSPIYETAPWGYADQPDFLNQVIKAETGLTPIGLLAHLKGIEQDMGRIASFRNAPRVIDLDILFYDDQVMQTRKLTIPHPRAAERAFILVPLADIAPDLHHPVLGRTIAELLAGIDTSTVKKYPVESPE
jgi:2-amino-4-hydroxy-6-hydroxymethyldihydropteridine diphosphokinase